MFFPSAVTHLDPFRYTCAVHATRHVHRVPPDIVLRLPGPDDAGNYRADVKTCEEAQDDEVQDSAPAAPRPVPQLTDFHLEVVEGVFVDVFHLVHHPHGVVGQGADVRAPGLVVRGVVEARGGHVGGADGLYLLQLTKLILADDLVTREATVGTSAI